VILSVCASRDLKRELIRGLVAGSSLGRLGWAVIRHPELDRQ
jgi:hypothetical protein